MGLIIEKIGRLLPIKDQKMIIIHEENGVVVREDLVEGRVITSGTYGIYVESSDGVVGRGIVVRATQGKRDYEVRTNLKDGFQRVEGTNRRTTFYVDGLGELNQVKSIRLLTRTLVRRNKPKKEL